MEHYMNAMEILTHVRQNTNPNTWQIFKGKRHHINDNAEVSRDDLPLLVITQEEIVEYIHAYLPITLLSFASIKEVYLQLVEEEAFHL
jgi:hypothetical protein